MRLRLISAVLLFIGLLGAEPGVENQPALAADGFEPLFNGVDLDGWYTWIETLGKGVDPEGYFDVKPGGILHVLGIPTTGEVKPFGYLATNVEYGDYHLRLQYKWGATRFAPRADALRDSGLLYHMTGPDTIWPTSLETQIQEGDTGDLISLGGPTFRTEVAPWSARYQAGGAQVSTLGYVEAGAVADSLTDWNTVEVIVRGNSAVHIVNGVVVNRLFDATLAGRPLTRGRIVLQAEGAEVFYRNIEIKPLAPVGETRRVLAFSKTAGFRHDSIPAALDAITQLGVQHGFTVDRSEDASVFTDANLARYGAVLFVSTTGDVLDGAQQAAFEQYIRGGGGFVGIHSASDTEYDWPWYGRLVGAYFSEHPAIQMAGMVVENRVHPSTAHLNHTWVRTDEWYSFGSNPRSQVNVLASLLETTYLGGTMGDHPIAWYHSFEGGRSWYTGGGHTSESYVEPEFRRHLLGGIQYAAGMVVAPTPPGELLERERWTASASPSDATATAWYAFDDDSATRFTTGQLQAPGMYLQIDLGTVERIDRVVLSTGENRFDQPRGFAVTAATTVNGLGSPIATGVGSSPETIIDFAPVSARFVRVTLTGSASDRWWSVADVQLRAAPAPGIGSITAAVAIAPARRIGAVPAR